MINEKNSNLDVLLLCDNNLDLVGGGKESTKIIVDGIKGSYSVALIQPGKVSKESKICNIYEFSVYNRMKELVKHPISFLKYYFNVYRVVKTKKPTIIHTQAQVSFFMVALLKKLKLINYKVTLIHTERGLYTKYGKIIKKIFMLFIKELDVLVTTTNFNMRYWKEATKFINEEMNFKVIENTAGKIYETLDESKMTIKKKSITIGFAGRYCGWKNWQLAEAICNKLNTSEDINFNVIMAIGCLDNKSRFEAEKMIIRLQENLGNRFQSKINVKFEEMDDFYYDIDIFILTSNYNTESFGRTLVEAMSRKTIVLTTNAGGSVEVVGNNENVCETADEFIKRIVYFLSNDELMKSEKQNNLLRVKHVYSLKNNVEKHFDMYKSIVAGL